MEQFWYILVLIVHVIVCLVLVMVVLLQAGRGGGFSDMMGGAQPQSVFGTQTNEFMTRATEICAVAFICTSLTLGIMSAQKGKSLMEKRSLLDSLKKAGVTLPATAKPSAAVPVKTEPVKVSTAPASVPAAPADAKKA